MLTVGNGGVCAKRSHHADLAARIPLYTIENGTIAIQPERRIRAGEDDGTTNLAAGRIDNAR
jgi:hypothetical protein